MKPDQQHEGVGQPEGDVYDWYVRGLRLLESGHPAAATQLLVRAHDAEPDARNILEALARARLATGHYAQARDDFAYSGLSTAR